MAQLPGNARVAQYTATAGQTVFIYGFLIYNDDEIIVQSGETTLTLTTDYTVQDAGEDVGGTITLVVGATVDTIITLTGNSMIERDTVFTNGGDYLAEAINGEYDKLDNITSEITTDQSGNFRLAVYSDTVSKTVPNPSARTALVWDSAGTALENTTYDPDEQVTLATAQVVLCEAQTALCVAETAKCVAETALCVAETAKCVAQTALASGYATDASDSADDAAASAASIDPDAFGSDLIPDADGTRDLGSTAVRWAEAYSDAMVITDTLTVNGIDITGTSPMAQYRHSLAAGSVSGNITAATWTARPINTEVIDEIGITLDTNVLTLPAGDYHIHAHLLLSSGNGHVIRLVHNADDTLIDSTVVGYWPSGQYGATELDYIFTLASETAVRFDQYQTSQVNDYAFGYKSALTGYNENYATVTIIKRG